MTKESMAQHDMRDNDEGLIVAGITKQILNSVRAWTANNFAVSKNNLSFRQR